MHVPYETPAAVADRAVARGMEVRLHRPYAGEPLPEHSSVGRLVVMGGPMGACDDAVHPWLPAVRDLLASLVARGTPVLGVCLGAQLLAAACGGRVYPGPQAEIGPGRVRLQDAAADDPLLGVVQGRDLEVFHWHGDTFDLPEGATLLASSEKYPNQAFRIANAWGLQFHVELRAQDADVVSEHLDAQSSVSPTELAAIAEEGTAVIDAFCRFAGASVHRMGEPGAPHAAADPGRFEPSGGESRAAGRRETR